MCFSDRHFMPVLVLLLAGGCAPPDRSAASDDEVLLDVTSFVRDQPAIADSWYAYDAVTHILTPRPQSYIFAIDDVNGRHHVGVDVRSYYDADSAASGWFTFGIAAYDDADGWQDAVECQTPHSVRFDGPVCVDLLQAAAVDCDDDWHLQARVFPLLVAEAGLVVGNPGLFVHSVDAMPLSHQVTVSTHEGVELQNLPAPDAVLTLPSSASADLNWERKRMAPNLPVQGMAIGADLDEERVHFLLTPRRTLERFTLHLDDTSASISFASATLNDEGDGFGPFSTTTDVDVPLPADGRLVFVALQADDAMPFGNAFSVADQLQPPDEREWDFALERVGGQLRVTLSPSCAVKTEALDGRDLEDALPSFSVVDQES